VKAHKGKIWAESREGINTFAVLLPVTTERK
jgi:signal transduction histidine kinase